MLYKREKALDLLPYKPVLSTPLPNHKNTFYEAINYFLVIRSSMSANNNSYKIHIYFLPSVSGQATQRTLPSTPAFDFFFPQVKGRDSFQR